MSEEKRFGDRFGELTQNEHQQMYDDGTDDNRRVSVTGRRVSLVDDVFGQIVEGGPNYRNVSLSHKKDSQKLTLLLGGLVRNCRPYDEDPNWSWCPLDPSCCRRRGHDSRYHYANHNRCDHNMVRLHGRCI